ncbi:MAG: hypothetical protein KME03_00255 [Aphanocapsa lilacina HA4352-LM1]|nr:hypothetical protein [Aphanocapsa lilacina HA4352-LM1]
MADGPEPVNIFLEILVLGFVQPFTPAVECDGNNALGSEQTRPLGLNCVETKAQHLRKFDVNRSPLEVGNESLQQQQTAKTLLIRFVVAQVMEDLVVHGSKVKNLLNGVGRKNMLDSSKIRCAGKVFLGKAQY